MKQKCSVFDWQHGVDGREHHTLQSRNQRMITQQASSSLAQTFVYLPNHLLSNWLRQPPAKERARPTPPLERHTGSIHLLNSCWPPSSQPRDHSSKVLPPFPLLLLYTYEHNSTLREIPVLGMNFFYLRILLFMVRILQISKKWITTIPLWSHLYTAMAL